MKILVNAKYRIDFRIGKGGLGLVYAGTDEAAGEDVAIKLMHTRMESDMLKDEADVYRALSGGIGIPQILWSGYQDDYYALVHTLLGPSLEDLLNYCGRHLSLKTILLVADQAISRIEYIHSKGFLHRDIKPDNLLMGVGEQGNILYAIDFDLTEDFGSRSPDRPQGTRQDFGGTRRFASLNSHNGLEQSWSDDLESLGYIIVYFSRGKLPWQGLRARGEFVEYIKYTRSLALNEKLDYARLRQSFRRLFIDRGFEDDDVYDWTERRYYEMLKQDSGVSDTGLNHLVKGVNHLVKRGESSGEGLKSP